MKNLKLPLAAFILFFTLSTNAQFSISLNLGSRAPYQNDYCNTNHTAYYYLPEIEAYYDANSAVFIYNGPRGWIRSSYLPEYCRNFDINRGYKIALNYSGNSPYSNFDSDRQRYFRSNYRNYREEYNRDRNERRNEYAVAYNQNRYNKNDNFRSDNRNDRRNDYVANSNQNRYSNNDNNRNYPTIEKSRGSNSENRNENRRDRD